MINDEDIINDFVVESKEHLADIESQLLAIEDRGDDLDLELVNTIFRGVHSIKGAAGFIGLSSINQLAHSLENVLNLVREQRLDPTAAVVDTLLISSDMLRRLIDDVGASNDTDVSEQIKQLDTVATKATSAAESAVPTAEEQPVKAQLNRIDERIG